ncbi:MAG: UbiA family prenyltransferase, partial [Thermoplasmata archaeon]|nr:UbiA family prenyltransferase [Thermoplasmata archaeon]
MTPAPPSRAVHPALRLVRVGNVLVSFVGTVVGGLAALGAGVSLPFGAWLYLLLAAASTGCVTAAGNTLNDLGDRASDRLNHPDRPLVTGAITAPTARIIVLALLLLAGALIVPQALARPALPLILLVAVGTLLGYEFRGKSVGLAGNVQVALLTGLVFLYGAASTGPLLPVLPLVLMAFFATASREVIKDMEDAGGDLDRSTFPQTHGLPAASQLARALVGAAIALSVLPLLLLFRLPSIAGIMYLLSVLAADALFVVSVLYLPGRLHAEQRWSKIAMSVALLAFLALAFRYGPTVMGRVHQYLVDRLRRGPLHLTLIDPEKSDGPAAATVARAAVGLGSDAIMLGGSTGITPGRMGEVAKAVKAAVPAPTIIFPEGAGSVAREADAIFFMSLLNSRDPDLVIRTQARAALGVRALGLETVSLGYLVVAPGMRVGEVGRA